VYRGELWQSASRLSFHRDDSLFTALALRCWTRNLNAHAPEEYQLANYLQPIAHCDKATLGMWVLRRTIKLAIMRE